MSIDGPSDKTVTYIGHKNSTTIKYSKKRAPVFLVATSAKYSRPQQAAIKRILIQNETQQSTAIGVIGDRQLTQ